jgi:hypothetical protein
MRPIDLDAEASFRGTTLKFNFFKLCNCMRKFVPACSYLTCLSRC